MASLVVSAGSVALGTGSVLQDQPALDLAAVADSGDGDDTFLVVNGIYDSIVP
jgi:hypothetical protein